MVATSQQIIKDQFFSQYDQDKIIDRLFRNNLSGFFIDIGAHDGVTYSNTYFFEINRNYSGLCFEPNPDVYPQLIKNRKCECINSAVSNKTESVKFTKGTGYTEMLSGISKFRDNRQIERTDKDISIHGGEVTEIEVPAVNLNEVLNQRNIKIIDFLSLDIEGGELIVLKSIDLKEIIIKVIVVELNFPETKIEIGNYLKAFGFRFLLQTGSDGIFINRKYFNLLNPVIMKLMIENRFPILKARISKFIGTIFLSSTT